MQLNVGVRAKHARKPFCNTQAGYPESTALVESYCTTIVLQSGLQVEPLWPPASCCTGPLKSI
jgi:hypothetical protein